MATEVGFRISDWDTPLRANPNRTAGRFNEAGSQATQYLGLHPLTPWAEYLRFNDLRDPEELAERRLRIWAIRVDLTDAAEIGYGNAARFGLEPGDLVDDDHGACRRFADRLRNDASAPHTLIVPSAALPGTRNVVILGERVSIPYSWEPLEVIDLPACVIAERSHPPDEIISLTRFVGDPHPDFDAWGEGRHYQFPDLREPLSD